MSVNEGPSSFDIMNRMEAGRGSNPGASHGLTAGGGSGMFPVGEQAIDISFGSVDAILTTANMDSIAPALNAGGGAFGQTITNQIEGMIDQHGVGHAKGEQGLKLESLGQSDRVAPPNVQGDLQIKSVGVRGGTGGQEM